MIVVTGGTGLLGGHLLLSLANENLPVRVIIRKGGNPEKVFHVWRNYPVDSSALLRRFEWYEADLTNKSEASDALKGATQIYHCAGLVSFAYGRRREMWDTNVTATGNLVDSLLESDHAKLVHVSSIAAIGPTLMDGFYTEQSGWPVNCKSMYEKTKTHGEFEVWRGIAEGLNAVIVNPSIILGPAKWDTSSARIFDTIYNGLLFYTRGINGYVDVRDVADAMINLMNSNISGERYILNAVDLSFSELFNKISDSLHVKRPKYHAGKFLTALAWQAEFVRALLTGHDPIITKTSMRSAHAKQFYSSEKFRLTTGYSYRDIDDTIRHTASCFLK
jgi:dihydroflavonol-4-reductase